jgi:hypothetical protein
MNYCVDHFGLKFWLPELFEPIDELHSAYSEFLNVESYHSKREVFEISLFGPQGTVLMA